MKRNLFLFIALSSLSPIVLANVGQLTLDAIRINKAGSIAAGFSEIGKSRVDTADVDDAFSSLGPRIQEVARQWAKDEELRHAPPAFRRFLFFEYLTEGTDIIAGSSNPPDRLINLDADIDNLIPYAELADIARKQMNNEISEPEFVVVGDQLLATFPMMPPKQGASKCIACHASTEVNRPYPENTRVLGYTFVVQPQ
ncbi:MAG: hypothetical protein AAF434_00575 [Pseudomonadota bacterium]